MATLMETPLVVTWFDTKVHMVGKRDRTKCGLKYGLWAMVRKAHLFFPGYTCIGCKRCKRHMPNRLQRALLFTVGGE